MRVKILEKGDRHRKESFVSMAIHSNVLNGRPGACGLKVRDPELVAGSLDC